MEFLSEVKQAALDGFENQGYQFEDLVERVSVARDVSRNPLFDVSLVLQNFADFQQESRAHEAVGDDVSSLETAKFDLTLAAVESGSRLMLSFNYRTALFKRETIERLAAYFKQVVRQVTVNPHVTLAAVDIMPPEERARILNAVGESTSTSCRRKSVSGYYISLTIPRRITRGIKPSMNCSRNRWRKARTGWRYRVISPTGN